MQVAERLLRNAKAVLEWARRPRVGFVAHALLRAEPALVPTLGRIESK